MLAIIGFTVDSSRLNDVSRELSQMVPVEELYRATGESNMFALISVAGIQELRDFLETRVMRTNAVKGTVTSILLHSYKGPKNKH